MTSIDVKQYLSENPQLLEEFLCMSMSEDKLGEILDKKRSQCGDTQAVDHSSKLMDDKNFLPYFTDVDIKGTCERINDCVNEEELFNIMNEVCSVLKQAIKAESFAILTANENQTHLTLFDLNMGEPKVETIGTDNTVAGHVAVEKSPLLLPNVDEDSRFPNGIGFGKSNKYHVMSVPIQLSSGSIFAVIEFYNSTNCSPFGQQHFDMLCCVMSWVGACIQKIKMNKLLKMQDSFNNFLLESTKVMFDDMYNTDQLVTNIMTFTKDLVSADRCALFLVDEERNELYADYFDEGKTSQEGFPLYVKKSQIRFSRELGIAGYVAKTGEVVNIKNAYEDERFNTDIDKRTGYTTKNILCMPIHGKNAVLGVVQMINRKKGDFFTDEDVSAFKLFAVYCALALHYSRLYDMLRHQKVKYRVAVDVLHFFRTTGEEEVRKLVSNPYVPEEQVPAAFDTYAFFCYGHEEILPQLFIRMVEQTLGKDRFEMEKLCRFTLTMRKNYRPIQYHNWQHGFHVAHCVWRMIESCGMEFTWMEKIGLLIGGLAHDVDHRGYNNDFFKKLNLPMANLYTTSVMEQHHYKQTVSILQAEGHDILSSMSSEEYRDILNFIRTVIINTDLALYFPNNKFLSGLIEKDEFDIKLKPHRDGLISLIMTASDLCAITKPWETQKKTAKLIYEEFYMQGDEEKKHGIQPLPMMDRLNEKDIAKQQVGFINFVCKPMYTTLVKLLPKTEPLLSGCLVCKDNWEKEAAEVAAAGTS
ncbi:cAMP and cAMP-inhibited cGMP 3' [Mactra antiquata]